ncbi:MAG: TfoX/Sxy family protein [Burkholderiaceae bacterium]
MKDSGLVEHCLELLSPLGATRARRMFGGFGLYVDGLCVALLLRDTLYLKVDDSSRAAFEDAGCRPFTYMRKDGAKSSLGYYTAPEEAMESKTQMLPWSRRAVSAATAASGKKRRSADGGAPRRVAAKKASPAGNPGS